MKHFYKNPSHIIHKRGYVYNFHFHLVWVTKYRNKIFSTKQLVHEMKRLILHLAKRNEIHIEKLMVMPDHIHILLSFKPKWSATNVVRLLKGASGRLFLKKHPEIRKKYCWYNHIWSRSYYMGTVGDMSKETIKKYIANQYKSSPYLNLDKD